MDRHAQDARARASVASSLSDLKQVLSERGADLVKTVHSVNLANHWRNNLVMAAAGSIGVGLLLGFGARRLRRLSLSDAQITELANALRYRADDRGERVVSESNPGFAATAVGLLAAHPGITQFLVQALLKGIGSRLSEQRVRLNQSNPVPDSNRN